MWPSCKIKVALPTLPAHLSQVHTHQCQGYISGPLTNEVPY